MKTLRVSVLAGLTVLSAIARAELPPAADFSHEPAFKDLQLSPDGLAVAYSETIKGEHRLYLLDLKTNKKVGMELLGKDKALVHSSSFFWVNNKRFMYSIPITGTYTAIDRDGRNGISNIEGRRLLHLFRDEKYGKILMTGQDIALGEAKHLAYYYPNRPFVQEINPSVMLGFDRGVAPDLLATNIPVRIVENPGNVVDWVVTPNGVVSAARAIKGTTYHVLYRSTGEGAWGDLPGLGWSDPEAFPLGFSADEKTLYIGRISPAGTWGVYPYDLAQQKVGEPLLVHRRYDIVHPSFTPAINGVVQQQLIFSPKERALVGIRYATEYPRMLWLDQGLAEAQAALDQAIPNRVNSVVSMSDDRNRLIVLSWAANDPGTYYLFDRGAQKLEKLLSRMSWLDQSKLADVKPFRFKARDGVLIDGYLTVPQGAGTQNLPVVVLVDDYMNRSAWGFDPTSQYLASRGYAVIQVDPRGSAGYGQPFFTLSGRQAGRPAQADITDAVRWAITQKIADPKRVGIVGIGMFGGYFSLTSLMADPGLYCCGVDYMGTTDWSKVMDKSRIMPDYYELMVQKFGDPTVPAEASILQTNSPLFNAAAIKDPLLVMHDKDDEKWRYNQSKNLVDAIKAAGGPVEFQNDYDEKYGYLTVAKYVGDVTTFLQKHMPANPPAAN